MKNYIFLFLNVVSFVFYAQEWSWAKSYDSDYYNTEYGENIGVDKFGNAYVSGYYKNWNGPTIRVMWKYNNNGELLWRKPALPVSKLLTDPQGYSYAISNGIIYKFDPDGNYSLYIKDSTLYAISMALYPTGGLVVSGATFDSKGIVARFTSAGNKIWESINEYYANGMLPNALATDSDGNIYFTCIYKPDTATNIKFFIARLNSSGNVNKIYPSLSNEPRYITTDNDSNFYVSDYNFIAKYNSETGLKWTKAISADSRSYFPWLMTDSQNNIYIAGHFMRKFSIDGYEMNNTGYTSLYTYKFDSEGNFKWSEKSGGDGYPVLMNSTLSSNNEIYFTGGYVRCPVFGNTSLPCDVDKLYGDMFVAKMKDNSVVGIKENTNGQDKSGLVVYPNPSNGKLLLNYTSAHHDQNISVKIISVLGATVYSEMVKDFNGTLYKELTLVDLKHGVYFVSIQNGGLTETRKVIIQ